jgi:hypothetical protein
MLGRTANVRALGKMGRWPAGGRLILARQAQDMQTTAIERAVTGDCDPRERNSQAGGAGIVFQG